MYEYNRKRLIQETTVRKFFGYCGAARVKRRETIQSGVEEQPTPARCAAGNRQSTNLPRKKTRPKAEDVGGLVRLRAPIGQKCFT
jgi:hypothetical protein